MVVPTLGLSGSAKPFCLDLKWQLSGSLRSVAMCLFAHCLNSVELCSVDAKLLETCFVLGFVAITSVLISAAPGLDVALLHGRSPLSLQERTQVTDVRSYHRHLGFYTSPTLPHLSFCY